LWGGGYSLVLVVGIITNMDWDIMGIISLDTNKTWRLLDG